MHRKILLTDMERKLLGRYKNEFGDMSASQALLLAIEQENIAENIKQSVKEVPHNTNGSYSHAKALQNKYLEYSLILEKIELNNS